MANSDLAIGQQRLTFVVLRNDVPVTDTPAYVRFFKSADSRPQLVGEGAIPWVPLGATDSAQAGAAPTGTELTGIYYVNVQFDEAGIRGLGVTLGPKADPVTESRVQFTIKAKAEAVALGEKAVPVKNPTSKERPLQQIHTGGDADPGFHTMSIATAVASGKPSVLVFATPSFCRTRTCGPSLQTAVKAAQTFGGRANFVHIEPYELDESGNLVKNSKGDQFNLVEPSLAWRLPSEPWCSLSTPPAPSWRASMVHTRSKS